MTTTETKKVTVRICMTWDDGDEEVGMVFTVPKDVTVEEIEKAISDAHEFLCTEDEEDIYGLDGRNPNTLADYVCDEKNWSWNPQEYEVDLIFV